MAWQSRLGRALVPPISGPHSATTIPIAIRIRQAHYPPALTGLRGSHPGSFEVAHSVRDGDFWEKAGKPLETGETYDLVIVGGGISGLSAAHYFRKAVGEKARVLILTTTMTSAGTPSAMSFIATATCDSDLVEHSRLRVPRPTVQSQRP